MKLTGESKVLLAIVGVTVVIIAIAALVMTKPAPVLTKADLIPAGAYIKGNPDASVYLVEFSDFQCPACLAVKPVLDEVLKTHESKLLFVYRNFPLEQHAMSHQAARTAEAAGKQGKYWEMYDLLFANQDKFSEELFPQLAQQLGLDMTVYAKDYNDPSVAAKIQSDIADGNRFGINATPTFFLNGKKLELNNFNDLKTAVDRAVKL
jgi:protein-disulfide isomerase